MGQKREYGRKRDKYQSKGGQKGWGQKITDNPEKEMLEERKRGEGLQEEGSEWNEASPSKWECDQTGGWLR